MSTAVHERLVRELGDEALARAVTAVVATLQAQRSMLSGEDSGLDNVWLEFVVQVQGEHSYDWDFFEFHVMQTVEAALAGLTKLERQALALRTSTAEDWIEDSDGDRVPEDQEELVALVYGRLSVVAMDWEDDRIDRYRYSGGDGEGEGDQDDDDDDDDEDEDEGEDEG